MKIYAFDDIENEVKENNINDIDINDIKTDGISMRFGNRIVKFSVSDETVIDDSDYKNELKETLDEEKRKIQYQYDQYKDELKTAYNSNVDKLNKKIEEYNAIIKEKQTIPPLSSEMADKGLSVSKDEDGHIIWYLNCVYAPKYVNNRVIDPSFAKRLVTPIRLKLIVTDGLASDLFIVKLFGNYKFQHYHSISRRSDCWGDFKFSGEHITNEDQAYNIFTRALNVLETINEFSLGTRNPKGLSRFDTIKKHLLDKKEKPVENVKMNTRNTRTGIDSNTIEPNTENVWTV